MSMETAADFETGKFGTGCSQEKEIDTNLTFGKFYGFAPSRGQIFPYKFHLSESLILLMGEFSWTT